MGGNGVTAAAQHARVRPLRLAAAGLYQVTGTNNLRSELNNYLALEQEKRLLYLCWRDMFGSSHYWCLFKALLLHSKKQFCLCRKWHESLVRTIRICTHNSKKLNTLVVQRRAIVSQLVHNLTLKFNIVVTNL